MISVIAGENSFENERTLSRVIADFNGVPERVDGETLDLKQLPDLLMGMSLFATKRLVIIRNLSSNRALWNTLDEWIERISDEIHLVLVEPKPDKRTKTYKMLQKSAKIYESKLWTDRDSNSAQQWATQEAAKLGLELDKKSAQLLVERVGLDPWALWQALQKLAMLGQATPEIITEYIEPNETENAFMVFEAALKGDAKKVKHMLEILQNTEDPYRLLGLLSGQAFQLVVLSVAEVPGSVVATDLGIHPFVVSKLSSFAKKTDRAGARAIVAAFAEADTGMKTSANDPWLLLERALLKVIKTA